MYSLGYDLSGNFLDCSAACTSSVVSRLDSAQGGVNGVAHGINSPSDSGIDHLGGTTAGFIQHLADYISFDRRVLHVHAVEASLLLFLGHTQEPPHVQGEEHDKGRDGDPEGDGQNGSDLPAKEGAIIAIPPPMLVSGAGLQVRVAEEADEQHAPHATEVEHGDSLANIVDLELLEQPR